MYAPATIAVHNRVIKLTKYESHVLLVLTIYLNPVTKQCNPGLGRLAKDTDSSRSVVAEAVKSLLAKGIISKSSIKRSDRPDMPDGKTSNHYTLNLDLICPGWEKYKTAQPDAKPKKKRRTFYPSTREMAERLYQK